MQLGGGGECLPDDRNVRRTPGMQGHYSSKHVTNIIAPCHGLPAVACRVSPIISCPLKIKLCHFAYSAKNSFFDTKTNIQAIEFAFSIQQGAKGCFFTLLKS